MLSPRQFNTLTKEERFAIIEDYGTYLNLSRKDDDLKVCLFAVYNYHIEVYYNEPKDHIVAAIAFDDYRRLDEYVEQIDLTEVYAVL